MAEILRDRRGVFAVLSVASSVHFLAFSSFLSVYFLPVACLSRRCVWTSVEVETGAHTNTPQTR